MAYMRGDNYLWSDGVYLHLWAANGYDGWDESGWHLEDDGKDYPVNPAHLEDGRNVASGVRIPQEIMDEYVIMRLSQMIDEDLLQNAVDRAINKWPRISLQDYAEKIKTTLKQIKND